MKPDEVLDMSLDVYNAYIQGYQEHLFDYQLLAVHVGYWSGYYQSKKPKPLATILNKLIHGHKNTDTHTHAPDVDVEAFLQQEARFRRRLEQGGLPHAE